MADRELWKVPEHGGRAPGGYLDPEKWRISSPDEALRNLPAAQNAQNNAPASYKVGAALPDLARSGASRFNSGLATIADGAINAYGAADNFLRGAVGAAPMQYPKHPTLRAMARNGLVQVGAANQAPATNAAQQKPAAPAHTQRDPTVPTIATVTPATAAAAGTAAQTQRDPTVPTIATVTPATAAATSINGRPLGYGKMIDGVRVFSDGSGTGGIPRTMTNEQISGLARSINVADPGAAIPASMAGVPLRPPAGAVGDRAAVANMLARTPTLDEGVQRRMAMSRPQYESGFANATPQQFARSDLTAFLTRDPRSVIGRAARQLDMDTRPSNFTTRMSRKASAEARNAVLGELARAVGGEGEIAARGAADARRTASDVAINSGRNMTDLQRTQMQEAGANVRSALSRPAVQVPMADGTLGLLQPDGTVRLAMGDDGKPVRPAQDQPKLNQGDYLKAVSDNINRLLGLDPMTGQMPDGRAPSAEELAAAQRVAVGLVDSMVGRGQGAQAAQRPTREQFMAQARAANPGVSDADLERYYAQTYGG